MIDTFEKGTSIIIPGGQDELAARYFNYKFNSLCKNKNNLEKLNITHRPKGQYDLLPKAVLVDFTVASAITNSNNKIHSSQRYFLMKQDLDKSNGIKTTCTIKKLMQSVYFTAVSKGMGLKPLFKIHNYTTPKIYVGFDRIPMENALKTMYNRLRLVMEPNMRGHNLKKFSYREF